MLRRLKICCKPSSELIKVVCYLLCRHWLLHSSDHFKLYCISIAAAAALLIASV